MTFEKLTTTVQKFTHIIHTADIHVRLTKRHSEYREVFQRLYEDVNNSPDGTIVCVVGDICHNKSDLSPECVQMVSDFLLNLSDRREVILVPGNHDATLSNKTRLDSLSPIVEALNRPRIHYLKESKLYGMGNILFNNMCIFDSPENYILAKDIPEVYRNEYQHIIVLFHGPVDRSVTDSGFAISNPAIMPQLFEGHHIALLGDIHKKQDIYVTDNDGDVPPNAVKIRYPSSLIQQNHGEPLLGHGYTLWDLSDYSYKHVEVPNNYGYVTVDLKEGKILTDISEMPKKTYLRVHCLDCIPTEVKAAEAKISTLTEILESSRIRIESEADKKSKEALVCKNVILSDISDVAYQGKLIEEFLRTKFNIRDKTKIDKILEINKAVNVEIKKDDFSRNLRWTPVRFEWDNMFAFGEENFIDFSQMSGIYGIFGPNACGKSSIFSAICFCLFDKWERGFKAIVARNSSKSNFRCKFEFVIEGTHYYIEKIGEGTRGGNIKVQVNFWRNIDGKDEDLTDVMRRKTNDVIRDYIGTFEDFILTTLSIQNSTKNNNNFIDMGNTERKDLFVQLMGLVVFDRLYEIAYARSKELAATLKPHREKNYVKELDEMESALSITDSTVRDCQSIINDLSKQIAKVNESIVAETGKLIRLDTDVPTNLPDLELKRKTLVASLSKMQTNLKKDFEELAIRKTTMDALNGKLSEIDAEDLSKANQTYGGIQKRLAEEEQKHELKKVDMANKLDKLKKLSQYEYDPNCKFCVKNVFVVDARKTEKELEKDRAEIKNLEESVKELHRLLSEWSWVEGVYQTYTKLLNEHGKTKDGFTTLNTKILLAEKDIEKTLQAVKELDRKVDLYHRNVIAVESNQKTNGAIISLKSELYKLETARDSKNKQLLELTGKREILKQKILLTTEVVNNMIKTEEERELYEIYSSTIGRNGIPYQVICNAVPEFTREINAILSQIADFTIEIDVDEKNLVPYINYETKGRWPIEMSSGFERFVASIAIRVALINISNLQKSNFLIVDEGFGTIDRQNLPLMYTMFTYLKAHFDFVIIISHLDSLRDMVEKQIEISQIGNFSKVAFE